jgi:diacylglycerol kinase (ATP)
VGVALAVAVTLAIIQPGAVWIALVALASGAVIAAELFNTAVEHLADHLHPEQHPAIGVVKDCAAAASLISAVVAVGVGVCLLVHLYSL